MTKQEYIKSVYGEMYSILSDSMNENGFVSVEMINSHENNGMDYENFGYEYKVVETVLGQPGNYLWRPVSLKGIEHNNGWNQIEEKGMPKSPGKYLFRNTDGKNYELWYEEGFIRFPFSTHWRPIVEIPNPLY